MESILSAFMKVCASDPGPRPIVTTEHYGDVIRMTTINSNYRHHKLLEFTKNQIPKWSGEFTCTEGAVYKLYRLKVSVVEDTAEVLECTGLE
jgi:hypothetical protein